MSVAYVYDAAGRRVMKDFASGGADTVFLSAGDMEIAEYDGSGALLRRYVPGLKVDDRVAQIEANQDIYFYFPDRLGNVVAMTQAFGAVTDRYRYTPFGIEEPLALSGNPYRYTGRRFDAETGLYHYRARYYDPSDKGGSRFLEVDPVGYADSMNLYGYVANDPVNATDPYGKQACQNLSNCTEARNLNPTRVDRQTTTQDTAMDSAAAGNLPNYESMGDHENVLRFDQDATGTVTTSEVPEASSSVNGNTITTTLPGSIRTADGVGHSHPNDTSEIAPGPGDDQLVNMGITSNIAHSGAVIVVEKVDGQFRARVITDTYNIVPGATDRIQQMLDIFQGRVR